MVSFRRKMVLIGCLATAITMLMVQPVAAAEKISIQLKWKHAFQFAGIYMAKEKGFYRENGLDMTLIEGGPGRSSIDYVTAGRGRYGIADTGVLLAKAKGKPVRALACIFQQSPLALVVLRHSGIKSFADLRGKRVMIQPGNLNADIIAAMNKVGVRKGDFVRQEISYNIDDLIDGHTDAFAAYVTDQPHQLKLRDIPYRILYPKELGIEFYGDTLITSEKEVEKHPDRAEAVTQATLEGWNYALDHIDETVELILKKYNSQHFSSSQLYFEASETAKVILRDMVTLGYMSNYRWQQIGKVYASLGLMPASYPVEKLLFYPAPGFGEFLHLYKWQLIVATLLLLLTIFALQSVLLRRIIRARTDKLVKSEAMQSSTSTILQMIAQGSPAGGIFRSIIRIYERRSPATKASIQLLKQGKLYPGAAESLPEDFTRAMTGIPIGPSVGSCGTAAFLKRRVIVEDIATDPLWADYRELALSHDIKASWSEPILTPDGEVLGTVTMYYDVARKPTDDEIRNISNATKLAGIAIERDNRYSELNRLSRAVDQLAEGITITDQDGIIEYVNPAFTSITGYPREEVIGAKSKAFDKKYRDSVYKGGVRSVKKGHAWQGKVRDRRKDGTVYSTMVSASPVRNRNGEITHFVSVFEDLTERDKLEAQFQQAQKMEAIGTLVGGIAHDFNNILAVITGNLFLLKRHTTDLPHIRDKLKQIEELSNQAAEMIRQLLTFANKSRVEKHQLSLSTFLRDAIKLHRISVPESVELRISIEDDLFVSADETQIQQVLVNLLNNARDAVAEKKQPKILVTLERFRADESFVTKFSADASTRDYAHFSIRDNGHGIDPSQISHIYEPFFTTKEVGEGTGLGLSMVFGAIRSHEGFVDVESKVGKGTTFHIYLPLAEAIEAERDRTNISLEFIVGHGETILIADDDENLLATNQDVVSSLAYKTITATNGVEAVEQFRRHKESIDLVILDLVMPRMGGMDAAGEIRKISHDVPIIFTTGYNITASRAPENVGLDQPVLKKPFTVKKLSRVIFQALKR